MSQYLQFYLIHKESNTQLCVGYFCTTPARQIDSLGAFPYTTNKVELTEDLIKTYTDNIKAEIDSIKEYKEAEHKRRLELLDFVYKCSSKEVAESFYDKIYSSEDTITEYTEELEDWNYRLSKITFIIEAYKDNKDDWDLYYINC